MRQIVRFYILVLISKICRIVFKFTKIISVVFKNTHRNKLWLIQFISYYRYNHRMKYELTQHAIDVMNARSIKIEWIQTALESPSSYHMVSEVEEHYFAIIASEANRCIKVVVNPLHMKIVTAYFDRNMRKKGCKDEN